MWRKIEWMNSATSTIWQNFQDYNETTLKFQSYKTKVKWKDPNQLPLYVPSKSTQNTQGVISIMSHEWLKNYTTTLLQKKFNEEKLFLLESVVHFLKGALVKLGFLIVVS